MRPAHVVVGVVSGLIAAELTVRLVTASALDYQSFARPGIYCADTAFSVVPACAGVSMMMRVPGEERYVRAPLNRWGFRGPYYNLSHGSHVVKRVLLVGGMSQGFGAGLPDEETYAAEAARASCGSVEIHNVAMPGASAEVTWDVAERRLMNELHFDHVIVALYERLGHPDIKGRLVHAADQVADLAALNGLEYRFSRKLPKLLRESALAVRTYDLLARAELELKWWTPRLTRTTYVEGPKLREQESLAELLREMQRRSDEKGAEFSVLLLPWAGDTSDGQLRNFLPDMRFIDAHRAIRSDPPIDGYFPDGHYKAPITRAIGRMVAQDICAVDFARK